MEQTKEGSAIICFEARLEELQGRPISILLVLWAFGLSLLGPLSSFFYTSGVFCRLTSFCVQSLA